jgi:hypothetical protein
MRRYLEYYYIQDTMNLCKYSKIFGIPGKDVHKYRVFNIAIIDVVLSVLVAVLIYYLLKYFNYKVKFCYILIFVFLLGIILHRVFCVRTTIDKLLFPC